MAESENKGWLKSLTTEDGCCSSLVLKKDKNLEIIFEFCVQISPTRIGSKWKMKRKQDDYGGEDKKSFRRNLGKWYLQRGGKASRVPENQF